MSAWARRVAIAGLLALAGTALAPAGGLTTQSAHATPGRCAAGTGVTVVVDYGALGGGTRIACDAGGAGKSGWDVVETAGFPLDGVATQPGFVCRISGQPGPSVEACQRTPPSDRYWGLFWSKGSSGWKYSSTGVDGLRLPAGSSIGWRWQNSSARRLPGADPTGEAKPSPLPSPRPEKPAAGKPGSGGGGAGAAEPDPARPPASSAPRATAGADPSPASPTARPGPASAERQRAEKTDTDKGRRTREAEGGRDERSGATAATVEDSEVTSADSELVQPVSGDAGPGTDDVLLLVGAGLAAVGLAGFGILTARRRRA